MVILQLVVAVAFTLLVFVKNFWRVKHAPADKFLPGRLQLHAKLGAKMKSPLLVILILATLFVSSPASGQGANAPQVLQSFSEFGEDIGKAGIVASTALGLDEMYLSGEYHGTFSPDSFWHALRYDAAAETYVQSFVSPIYEYEIVHISLADLHPRPGKEIVIVLISGDVFLYHQRTKEELGVMDTNINLVNAVDHYDLNFDGVEELILLASTGLHIFDSNGVQVLNATNMTGNSLAVGQMDADPGIEIATTQGWVLDVSSRSFQCHYSRGFGSRLTLSDVDGDGMEELLYEKNTHWLWAFDVDLCETKGWFSVPGSESMLIDDLNGDGVAELILGLGNRDGIQAYNLQTRERIWTMSIHDDSITSLTLADCDQDGKKELIWGGGLDPGAENLRVANIHTREVEWMSEDVSGPFLGPFYADVDGDGEKEVVTASTESNDGYRGGRAVVLDPSTFVPHYSAEQTSSRDLEDMVLADVDGDTDMEILTVGRETIECLDYASDGTFTLLLEIPEPNDDSFYSIDVVDIDGDGDLEILAGIGGGAINVAAYDYNTGLEEWRSIQMGSQFWHRVADILHGDFDGDGQLEVACQIRGDSIYILKSDGSLEAVVFGDFQTMRLGPYVAGQAQSLYVGDSVGGLQEYSWNGSSYTVNSSLDLLSTAIDGFTALSEARVFVSSDGFLNLFHRVSGALIWKSTDHDEEFGKSVIEMENGDLVTSGRDAVLLYGVR